MTKTNKKGISTETLVMLSLLTALVALLSYMGGFIRIGGLASISLTLIPVVLGAALYGPYAGAWLGAVSGVVFFMTADAVFWFGLSIGGTVITVLIKGACAGLAAGYVYKLLESKNKYLAIMAAAVAAPVVNTGIFIIGCLIFFIGAVRDMAAGAGMGVGGFLIVGFVGLNFVFELIVNIAVAPALSRLLDIAKKKFAKKK